MDIKVFIMYTIFALVANADENIYIPKHICPPQLYSTLRKYNCVYYEPATTSSPNAHNKGIIPECCQNKCTEYYLVTSYCKRSTIQHVMDNSEILNQIVKEENTINDITQHQDDEITEKVINNRLEKNIPKVRKISKISKENNKKTQKPQKNKNRNFRNKRPTKIVKDCNCTCKKPKQKDNRTYKPPVIVFSKISPNPPIPIQRSYRSF